MGETTAFKGQLGISSIAPNLGQKYKVYYQQQNGIHIFCY